MARVNGRSGHNSCGKVEEGGRDTEADGREASADEDSWEREKATAVLVSSNSSPAAEDEK